MREIKVKVYYTLRELTNHIPELWALYSLNNEIFPLPKKDTKNYWETRRDDEWIKENLGSNVIPAWQHIFTKGKYKGEICASMLVESCSRLNNFYIEGLKWLLDYVNIDGLYIDDTAYGRDTMQRVRKILDKKPEYLIDLHSCSHMSLDFGYINSALLYMELFPYIDSLWLGEGFDYDESLDYWLIQISGIAYGLMDEMLQNDGNPYRGMLYGMTNRCGWGKTNPKPIHTFWDEFGIEDSKMYGYWVSNCPVKTDHKNVLATAYVKRNKTLISIASWENTQVQCKLDINWKLLGLDKNKIKLYSPEIEGFQEEKYFDINSTIPVQPSKGWLIIIE